MTEEDIALVRTSFAHVARIRPAVAVLFYSRLFAIDPALRGLFPSDMQDQQRKLVTMLGAAIGLLDRPAELTAALQALGARHAAYDVREEHFDSVGEALIETFAEVLGELFTEETRAAWSKLYGTLKAVMVAAMKQAALASAPMPAERIAV